MGIKSIFIMTAVVITAAGFQFCNQFCTPVPYHLAGGIANASPDKDSIQVGDTIWFSSSIPTKLKYQYGGPTDSVTYDLSGASNVLTDIHLSSLKALNTQVGAADSFLFIPVNGKIIDNPYDISGAKTVFYIEENDNFILSLGIVAQKKGIYGISILDIFQAEKSCAHISISILENNEDQHLHYLQDIYYGGQPIAPIDRYHSYLFKVY